jgi:hypothetical protein
MRLRPKSGKRSFVRAISSCTLAGRARGELGEVEPLLVLLLVLASVSAREPAPARTDAPVLAAAWAPVREPALGLVDANAPEPFVSPRARAPGRGPRARGSRPLGPSVR